jgi:hypothetical protein
MSVNEADSVPELENGFAKQTALRLAVLVPKAVD